MGRPRFLGSGTGTGSAFSVSGWVEGGAVEVAFVLDLAFEVFLGGWVDSGSVSFACSATGGGPDTVEN